MSFYKAFDDISKALIDDAKQVKLAASGSPANNPSMLRGSELAAWIQDHFLRHREIFPWHKDFPYRLSISVDETSHKVFLNAVTDLNHPIRSAVYRPHYWGRSTLVGELFRIQTQEVVNSASKEPVKDILFGLYLDSNKSLKLPMFDFMKEIDAEYYLAHQDFHDDVAFLDEFQADHSPQENASFADNLNLLTGMFNIKSSDVIGEGANHVDAFWREKFLRVWDTHCPSHLKNP